jgi:hypothetical protein
MDRAAGLLERNNDATRGDFLKSLHRAGGISILLTLQ